VAIGAYVQHWRSRLGKRSCSNSAGTASTRPNVWPSDRSAPGWAVGFALDYWGVSPSELHTCIAGIAGRRWLQHAWDHSTPKAFYRHPYQMIRQEWFHSAYPGFRDVDTFLQCVPRDATILDYGCGTAEWLRRRWLDQGRKALLVDMAGPLQPYLSAKYPTRSEAIWTVDEWQQRRPATTALVCLDVLEHVPEPLSTLTRLWDTLQPGGIAALWFDHSWPHPGHLRASIAQLPQYWDWLYTHGDVVQERPLTIVRKPRRLWGFFAKIRWQ